ncbi:alpha/beta hydrolase [Cyanobium sp. T1G-Tous]|uniref:alpha/beta fold hydrolase n=1 Tax=Cyanobium sp. T1G-Tous TaxID=2823722 RepID=UPI0020CEC109|nr:alpha/beta hydrolase [Cyanobium sp. T1G-Tous]MCP9802652.1 alpha/beta hydrolase [Cyanobium sp. T1G-Tous]
MQLIAMHGWAGDAQGWEPFHSAWSARGWAWQCGERGYGGQAPRPVAWQSNQGLKLVIAHSLGPHLLPAAVLAQADAVVLLASFGAFLPEGPGGRRLRSAVAAMASQLAGPKASAMLQTFMERAAAPQPASLLPPGIAAAPLDASGRQRLAGDLNLLAATAGLPTGFPLQARVLIVEGGEDQIVSPQARQQLRSLLPAADTLVLAGVGHCLLSPALVPTVCGWIEGLP